MSQGLVRRPRDDLHLQPRLESGRWGWTVYAEDDPGPSRPPVPPAVQAAAATAVPVEHGDLSLAFRRTPAALADGALAVPLADGTVLRRSAADGSAVPDPAARTGLPAGGEQ